MVELFSQVFYLIAMAIAIATLIFIAYPFFILKNFKAFFLDKLFYIITVLVFALDQYTKKMAIVHLKSVGLKYPVIKKMLYFYYVENYGAAFGILQGKIWLFKMIAIMAILVIIIYSKLLRKEDYLSQLALAFLLGGALGNFFDRLHFGYVVDFIYFKYKTFEWPVFNLADVFIDIGVFILLLSFVFEPSAEEKEKEKKNIIEKEVIYAPNPD